MNLMILIFLVLANFATLAIAGGVGNGGFILECKEGLKTTYKLYDYEEFRPYGFVPDLGPNGLSTKKRVEFVLRRLERVNPTRANLFRKLSSDFFYDQEDLKVSENDFVNVNDLGAAKKPKNCILRQIVQQRSADQRPLPNQKTYIVDRSLFTKIEHSGFTDVTAGLVLHEVAYNEYLTMKDTAVYPYDRYGSATLVRYFNALISSKKMRTISELDYAMLALGSDKSFSAVMSVDFGGVPFKPISRLYNGPLESDPPLFENKNTLTTFVPVDYPKVTQKEKFPAKFHHVLGSLECWHFSVETDSHKIRSCTGNSRIKTPLNMLPIDILAVEFNENGKITFVLTKEQQMVSLRNQNVYVYGVSFFDSGLIKTLLGGNFTLKVGNNIVHAKSVSFDKDGRTITKVSLHTKPNADYAEMSGFVDGHFYKNLVRDIVALSGDITNSSFILAESRDSSGRCRVIDVFNGDERVCQPQEQASYDSSSKQ